MLVGYNTNISYKGRVYHVQTEDSGIKNPHIITLLYYKGTILSSRKISYANIAAAPDYREKVRELMKEQHKAMIKELISGRHTKDQIALQAEGDAAVEMSHPSAAEAVQAELTEAADTTAEATPDAEQKAERQLSRSLDDILLDYILKEEKK